MNRGFIKLGSEFLIGDLVRHEKYGIGKVTGIEGNVRYFGTIYSTGFWFRVDFEDGTQKSLQECDLEFINDEAPPPENKKRRTREKMSRFASQQKV